MFQYPQRSVEDHCLHSSDLPEMRVQFANSLDYLGNLKTTVQQNSVAIDNYYFVDKNAEGLIQRIVYLQFETYLPEALAPYDYPPLKDIQLGNFHFGYDGGVRIYHQIKIEESPDSDIAQTVAFLKSKGIQFHEGQLYGSLRFVHCIGETKRDEVLILYLEQFEDGDVPDSIVAKSRESQEWPEFCEQFLERALRSFTVCKD